MNLRNLAERVFNNLRMTLHPWNNLITLGRHKHQLDKIAEVNGLLSGLALFPQVFKAVASKSVEGLSVYTFLFIFVNSAVWIFYARHRSLPQLFISSFLNCVASGLLLFFIFFS